jgi:antitoxin ParD1/3/4
MNISLDPKLRAYLEAQVKSGRYADVSEAVNGAVALAREQESLTAHDVARIRREIQIGIEAADRGEFSDFTAEDVIARGRRILAARRRGGHGKANGRKKA